MRDIIYPSQNRRDNMKSKLLKLSLVSIVILFCQNLISADSAALRNALGGVIRDKTLTEEARKNIFEASAGQLNAKDFEIVAEQAEAIIYTGKNNEYKAIVAKIAPPNTPAEYITKFGNTLRENGAPILSGFKAKGKIGDTVITDKDVVDLKAATKPFIDALNNK